MKLAILLAVVVLVSCTKVATEKDPRIETLTEECSSLRALIEELQSELRLRRDRQESLAKMEELNDWQTKELEAIQACLRKSNEGESLMIEELKAHGRGREADIIERAMWDRQGMDKKSQDLILKLRKEAADDAK